MLRQRDSNRKGILSGRMIGKGHPGLYSDPKHTKYGSGLSLAGNNSMIGEGSLLELVKAYKVQKNVFPNERHYPQFNREGKAVLGNYIGPDTEIVKRLESSNPKIHDPVSKTDAVAMKHDVEYALAEYSPNRTVQRKKIREADKEMISRLKAIQKKKADNPMNIQIGLRGIQGKVLVENLGILSKDKFSGTVGKIGDEDLKTLELAKEKLEQEGMGVGAGLKMKVLKDLERKEKKKERKSKKRGSGLELAESGPVGMGLVLAGNKGLSAGTKTMVEVNRKLMEAMQQEGDGVLDWLKDHIAKPLAKGWGTFVSALKPIGDPVMKAVGLGDEYDAVQGLAEKAKAWGGSGITSEHLMNQLLHHRKAFEHAIDFLEKQKTVLDAIGKEHPHYEVLKESIGKQQKFVKKFVSVVKRLKPLIGGGKHGMMGSGMTYPKLHKQVGAGILSAVWNLAKGLISKIAPSVVKAGTSALVSKGAEVIGQKTGVDLSKAVTPVSDAISGKVSSVITRGLSPP